MTTETYVVTGATGAVGKVVMEKLKAQGHEVRPISRGTGVSFDDDDALKQAFFRATGAFVMIPFDMKVADLHKWEDEIGLKLAEAIRAAHVQRVVFLSGTSAHLRSGSSLGAAMMEERLDRLGIAELVHVRGAFIMENFIKGMSFEAQAKTGVYSAAFKPDLATPMIASKDIGEKIADLLLEKPFHQPRVRELLGPRDYTMEEATRILGSAIGKPDVRYVQCSFEDARKGMLAMDVSPSFADAVMQTARSFNEGDVWAKENRSLQNTTPTTLEQFARNAFQNK